MLAVRSIHEVEWDDHVHKRKGHGFALLPRLTGKWQGDERGSHWDHLNDCMILRYSIVVLLSTIHITLIGGAERVMIVKGIV